MQKLANSSWAGPAISGLFTFIAICQTNFLLGFICYVPLFISVFNQPAKVSFTRGFLFGLIFSIFAFYWMIPGAERFTGYSKWYGFAVFLLSALLFSLYSGCLIFCVGAIKKNVNNSRPFILNSIVAACIFCMAEALLMQAAEGFPWFAVYSGSALTANLYAIQPAAFFGIYVLSFVIVFVNYSIARLGVEKNWKNLFIPVTVVLLYLLAGYLILQDFEKETSPSNPFKVVILAENIMPEIKWDDANGNALVQKLLNLNHEAVASNPDIILWSESAIPWTYQPDDDLVNEVLKITAPAHVTHIMGINTAVTDNVIYNSAYAIDSTGKVTGRYDKQFLLSLIEKPINGALIPFFSSLGFIETNNPAHGTPLTTPYGKAGIMICNESTVPQSAALMVKQGAQFLLNMSNDGWFNNTYITDLHFQNARMRAVETRKDVAVNCNNGFSGLIKASGHIDTQQRSTDSFVQTVTLQPNNFMSISVRYPFIFIYCCGAVIIVFIFLNLVQKTRWRRD